MNKAKKLNIFTIVVGIALFLIIGIFAWMYFAPYSYVSLDVNPSIEYTLNRFEVVLDAKAANEDGEEILEGLDLTNLGIEDALKTTLLEIQENGYFSSDEPLAVVLSASAPDELSTDRLVKELQQDVEDAMQDVEDSLEDESEGDAGDDENADIEIEVVGVGRQRVLEAHELGVTPGKLNLVQKLQASMNAGEEFDLEAWLHRPVRDIMKTINQNRLNNEMPEADDETIPPSEMPDDGDGNVPEDDSAEQPDVEEPDVEKPEVEVPEVSENNSVMPMNNSTKINGKKEEKIEKIENKSNGNIKQQTKNKDDKQKPQNTKDKGAKQNSKPSQKQGNGKSK